MDSDDLDIIRSVLSRKLCDDLYINEKMSNSMVSLLISLLRDKRYQNEIKKENYEPNKSENDQPKENVNNTPQENVNDNYKVLESKRKNEQPQASPAVSKKFSII
jgi:hypothetical protein